VGAFRRGAAAGATPVIEETATGPNIVLGRDVDLAAAAAAAAAAGGGSASGSWGGLVGQTMKVSGPAAVSAMLSVTKLQHFASVLPITSSLISV
jgi:hypothetical protein